MSALPSPPPAAAPDPGWLTVTYRVASSASEIEKRAKAIAVEQSVEMPVEAIRDRHVLDEIVGRVDSIEPDDGGHFKVTLKLAVETTGFEGGQLLNMAFGNTSLQPDVELTGLKLPANLLAHFTGPRFGIAGIRERLGATGRALTCTALKPQGLPVAELAKLAGTFARAGVDIVKDDHGLANQRYSPFAERVAAVQEAIDAANRETGHRTLYAPTLSGSPTQVFDQARTARDHGVGMLLFAPMLSGFATLQELVRDHAQVPVLGHPAFAGATRIAPPLLIGKIFRLFGADAVIFPNYGGRFAYSPMTCRAIANCARHEFGGLRAAMPVPAGGMSVERVAEMKEFYGRDSMFLIGGSLLAAPEGVLAASRGFVAAVHA